MLRILLMPVLALSLAGAASAENWGDPASGRRIAERWCAACHIVSPEQTSGIADVRSFQAIAALTEDPQSLATFLADPHPVMSNIQLTRREIGDLVAYIASLR
ncbi:c-type cytochrome [Aureimonas glaciei]|uniref:Cytochrome c-552 n=1 Tax=Aureimonas glaciei TaxID=1776957 RepID=A0A916YDT2_9HYPH|nr:c-type cytochrome [Aureimonas glaciei]GGD41324.1 cytochrome c-552 [Aureimonas glaciei]